MKRKAFIPLMMIILVSIAGWVQRASAAAEGAVTRTVSGTADACASGPQNGPVLHAASAAEKPQAVTQPADTLTLQQAVRMAVAGHPLVQQAEHAVSGAEARIGTSRSVYYPDVYFSGAYTLLEPVPSIDMPDMGSFDLYPQNNYDMHLGVRQTIYDFGRRAGGVRLAESAKQVAGDNIEVIKAGLAYRTISVFEAILILKKTVGVIDEQIATLEEHLQINAKMIEAGTATDFDSLTTEVRIASARNDRVDALRAIEENEITLKRLTGIEEGRKVSVTGSIDAAVVQVDEDSALAAAEKGRPELVLSRDAERSAEIQVKLASLGNRPSLALALTSGFKNGYVPDLDKLKANMSAGVQLMVPVFDGHRTRHQREEAEASVRAARAHTADVERQIAEEVRKAIAGVRSSLLKIDNSRVQVSQAEAALSRAEARYEAGVVTNMDLLDMQAALSQARLLHLRSVYGYLVSLNALDRATGKKAW